MIDLYTIFYYWLWASFGFCSLLVIFCITCSVMDWLEVFSEQKKRK